MSHIDDYRNDTNREIKDLKKKLLKADKDCQIALDTQAVLFKAIIKFQSERNEQAMRYLGELLHAHYPQLNLLDDIYGRIMQIDNAYVAGWKQR